MMINAHHLADTRASAQLLAITLYRNKAPPVYDGCQAAWQLKCFQIGPNANARTELVMHLVVTLFAIELFTSPPGQCIAAESMQLASTVERPARLLNPAVIGGRLVELQVSRPASPSEVAMRPLLPELKWRVTSPDVLTPSENLVGFVVDSTGAVVTCSIRFRQPVADSAPLTALLSRLRFAPAQVAKRRVPQLFVARLLH